MMTAATPVGRVEAVALLRVRWMGMVGRESRVGVVVPAGQVGAVVLAGRVGVAALLVGRRVGLIYSRPREAAYARIPQVRAAVLRSPMEANPAFEAAILPRAQVAIAFVLRVLAGCFAGRAVVEFPAGPDAQRAKGRKKPKKHWRQ